MGSKTRKWILNDGSIWTTTEVMDHVGCSQGAAYYRLRRSTDPLEVLEPRTSHKVTAGRRVYILDDKSEWTARQVADEVGCKLSTASTRLSTYTSPDKILASPLKSSLKEKGVATRRRERMFFDPQGHWKLLMRNT